MDKKPEYDIQLLRKQHIENDYYYFDFKKPEGFSFEEGQYAIFKIPDQPMEGRNTRAFSIASSNDEDFIRISTKIIKEPSDFKRILLNMPIGESIKMSEPKGNFTLEKDKKAIFIAGGIGITPIRSMVISNKRNNEKRDDVLIYSELDKCYPFKEEVSHFEGIEIRCAADIEPTQRLIKEAAEEFKNDVVYYLSGSPGFVNGLKKLLMDNNIEASNIKHDVFVGY